MTPHDEPPIDREKSFEDQLLEQAKAYVESLDFIFDENREIAGNAYLAAARWAWSLCAEHNEYAQQVENRRFREVQAARAVIEVARQTVTAAERLRDTSGGIHRIGLALERYDAARSEEEAK